MLFFSHVTVNNLSYSIYFQRKQSVFLPVEIRGVKFFYFKNQLGLQKFSFHSKKKGYFTEPLKKVPQISESVQRSPKSQKKDKKFYKTFKGSSLGHTLGTFSYETFFKVPYSKKRFRRKNTKPLQFRIIPYETTRVQHETIMV